ncbi:schlafen-like protein 1 [Plakobranchus ocellatus]|uniref:Schlafen-like protein 1 n=1 Tax=Plakobranchus ocellatus TaxID=259542 RepID=A0AAV4DAY3_9GAST|nr:schlafen-like protein 1 [Plakobranchus ocellatus]
MTEQKGKSSVRGIILSPLFTDKATDEMAKNVFGLLYCLGVKCADISQISVSAEKGFASVYVRNTECENYLVTIFRDLASVMNQYDLRRITPTPQKLSVTRMSEQANQKAKALALEISTKREQSFSHAVSGGQHKASASNPRPIPKVPESHKTDVIATQQNEMPETLDQNAKSSSTIPASYSPRRFKQLESENDDFPKTGPEVSIHVSTSSSEILYPVKDRNNMRNEMSNKTADQNNVQNKDVQSSKTFTKFSNFKSSAQLNTLGTKPIPTEPSQSHSSSSFYAHKSAVKPPTVSTLNQVSEAVIKLHAKTSTPKVETCGCPEAVFYHLHQLIGAETRHAEFKRGGIVREQCLFRSVVGKYMCGFLNSEGGTLYFGVNDDGKVLGIRMDEAMKETLKDDVDFAVCSLLAPSVNPSEYLVNFARVMEPSGQLSNDLMVMEVCVKPRLPRRRHRFSCDGVVYLRRDGSLQAVGRRRSDG